MTKQFKEVNSKYGNTPEQASIHISSDYENVQDYPDYILESGPRSGVKVEAA